MPAKGIILQNVLIHQAPNGAWISDRHICLISNLKHSNIPVLSSSTSANFHIHGPKWFSRILQDSEVKGKSPRLLRIFCEGGNPDKRCRTQKANTHIYLFIITPDGSHTHTKQ